MGKGSPEKINETNGCTSHDSESVSVSCVFMGEPDDMIWGHAFLHREAHHWLMSLRNRRMNRILSCICDFVIISGIPQEAPLVTKATFNYLSASEKSDKTLQ